ncbi:SDR family NAD(P)-dependent oxidoreductase [Nocardioides pocheonensis]|uniref:SDR family oxidoreductase n=1 Tax=Nocardioides pocheonensis TaxID=661485 RepID=A0A3N0GHT5_9ACTN|nr:SDR family oxidoreductase [Nocardioides pocheonensis]RNM12044.1 SDR family oxidoreductase [Nocardioides pocheonensis]
MSSAAADGHRDPRVRRPKYYLDGHAAIVFGAGSSGAGLSNGEAAARAYAEAGAAVAVVDVNAGEAERVAKAINAVGGVAIAITADVTREQQVVEAVRGATQELGVIDVLHNNVGVARTGSVLDVDVETWEAAVRLNLTSAYLTVRHILPGMLEAGRGAIINVSSVASIRDTGYVYPVYNATKAALNQLTVSLALTYAAQGIRANAVLPGLIDTPLVVDQITDDPAALAARHAASPTGRMGSPWDVAHASVFLASDAAAYVNGVCLPVDGGLSARCI